MIRSVSIKFIAFVLAACFLVCGLASVIGTMAVGRAGLYDFTAEEVLYNELKPEAQAIAVRCLQAYTTAALGGCGQEAVNTLLGDLSAEAQGHWGACVVDGSKVLWSKEGLKSTGCTFEFDLAVDYYTLEANGRPVGEVVERAADGSEVTHPVFMQHSPEFSVVVQLSSADAANGQWPMLELLYEGRYWLIAMCVVSLLLFAAFFVYLCCVSGRSPGSATVRASGLNRLPLDLYTALLAGLGALVLNTGRTLMMRSCSSSIQNSTLIIAAAGTTALSLLVLAFFFALAAQLKTRGGFWWRNSLIVRIVLLTGKCIRWCFRGSVHIISLLPVLWQWLLVTGIPLGALVLLLALDSNRHSLITYGIWVMAFLLLALVGYGGYAFGILLRGIRRMSKGDLKHSVNTRYLIGPFQDFGQRLNSLSEAAMLAAESQVRSERMKTELITNVSHDIKTPLTSIINYVDLLSKPHGQQEQEQYLEVLNRQSLRLKRLIEDLIELSKASSGNLPVELAPLDATEVIRQALGEFSEKLSRRELIPIFDLPDRPVMIMADGRLVWRVLSNLLGNAVKYAMTGTRVYLDLTRSEGQVFLSVKNISAQQLGISAEELLERFVRGDTARNTEGSGLGLNIAKSLMEIQQGHLQLKLDGDLFKVTLIFPEAVPE